ncbi:MAG: undecaprenyl-diphosphate phosphatase [Gammaproteobacteria bacterium]|nr:undecaprenyl-diphosphate phosphatase [Gammaproteobacteria bacterium]
MDWIQASIIALIQGVTEFLPISSSAHLLFPSLLLDWPDQGLTFDVAVHLGSLFAVVIYLRQDLAAMVTGLWQWQREKQLNTHATLALMLIVATLPAVFFGLVFKGWIEVNARALWVVAITTLVFGLLLGWADWRSRRDRELNTMSWRHTLMIGLAQALALLPGTSRSGITMTAALMLGYTREAAARFSFLMSIPIILAASLLMTLDLATSATAIVWMPMVVAFLVSFASAWLCIVLFMQVISRMGMWPFVVYRIVLGVGLCWLILPSLG